MRLILTFLFMSLLPQLLCAQNPVQLKNKDALSSFFTSHSLSLMNRQIDMHPEPEIPDTGNALTSSGIKKNQISIDLGALTFFIAYAHRIQNTKWSFGGGLGFAWELNQHSFERNVYEPGYIAAFIRYQYSHIFQFDIGPTLMRYFWTDDCSECRGTFVGLQTTASVGYKFVFLTPCLWVGSASDDRHGSEFGTIWNIQLRFLIPWD